MAKLVRKTQKIFGVNAPQNQITTFGSIKEGSPVFSQDVGELQTTAFESGWSAAVTDDYAPYRQDRNAVDRVVTEQLAYLFQEGIPEWDSATSYRKGSVVKLNYDSGFKLYCSKTDDNLGNNIYSTDFWVLVYDSNSPNQKQIAYENMRLVECSSAVTVNLQDGDEIVCLNVSDSSEVSLDFTQLTFPKNFYTVQLLVKFPNGVKTLSLNTSLSGGIKWINNYPPDFSSGKNHWVIIRIANDQNYVLGSDAGEEG